jgi:hypothetical protein
VQTATISAEATILLPSVNPNVFSYITVGCNWLYIMILEHVFASLSKMKMVTTVGASQVTPYPSQTQQHFLILNINNISESSASVR